MRFGHRRAARPGESSFSVVSPHWPRQTARSGGSRQSVCTTRRTRARTHTQRDSVTPLRNAKTSYYNICSLACALLSLAAAARCLPALHPPVRSLAKKKTNKSLGAVTNVLVLEPAASSMLALLEGAKSGSPEVGEPERTGAR